MDVQSHTWLLTVVIFSPMAGAILLMLPPRGDFIGARRSAMFCSLVTLAVTVYALTQFMDNAPLSSGDSAAYLLTMDVPWILAGYAATPGRRAPSGDAFDAHRALTDGRIALGHRSRAGRVLRGKVL